MLGPPLPDRPGDRSRRVVDRRDDDGVDRRRSRPSPDPKAATTIAPAPSPAVTAAGTVPVTTVPVSTVAPVVAVASIAKRPITSVLWTGDSIAYDLAPGVGAALTDAGLLANSSAYPGMRLVGDGQFALLPRLAGRAPRIGHRRDRRAAVGVGRRAATSPISSRRSTSCTRSSAANGAQLVLVSSPPTVERARRTGSSAVTEHARAIAAANPTSTVFLDSSAVWGADVRRRPRRRRHPGTQARRRARVPVGRGPVRAVVDRRAGRPLRRRDARRRRPSGHWATGSPMSATTSRSAPAPCLIEPAHCTSSGTSGRRLVRRTAVTTLARCQRRHEVAEAPAGDEQHRLGDDPTRHLRRAPLSVEEHDRRLHRP